MIQMLEIYRRTGIPNIYREELWLIRFAESPYRDPLEARFENAPRLLRRKAPDREPEAHPWFLRVSCKGIPARAKLNEQ